MANSSGQGNDSFKDRHQQLNARLGQGEGIAIPMTSLSRAAWLVVALLWPVAALCTAASNPPKTKLPRIRCKIRIPLSSFPCHLSTRNGDKGIIPLRTGISD